MGTCWTPLHSHQGQHTLILATVWVALTWNVHWPRLHHKVPTYTSCSSLVTCAQAAWVSHWEGVFGLNEWTSHYVETEAQRSSLSAASQVLKNDWQR